MTKTWSKALLLLLVFTPARWASLYPFDLVQFQRVLKNCRLQCPRTSKSIAHNGDFANIMVPGHFYAKKNSMVVAMDEEFGERCELRHNPEWSTAGVAQRFYAVMKVIPSNDQSFTIMQIHSKSFEDSQGKKYEKGPPLMVLRGSDDHLWAKLRVSLKPKKSEKFDLGPRPKNFFELKVDVADGFVSISLNGRVKLHRTVRHLHPLLQNYFKTGTYLHGPGGQRVEYKKLEMGPIAAQRTVSLVPTQDSTNETSLPPMPVSWSPTEISTQTPTKAMIVDLISVPVGPWIEKLALVDTEQNQDLFELRDGQVLDLSILPKFSIRAVVANETLVSTVVFTVDGKWVKKEDHEPFSIAGDSSRGGHLYPWNVDPGEHFITATPYMSHGIRGIASTVTIHVIRSATVSPTLTPTVAPTKVQPNGQPTQARSSAPTAEIPLILTLMVVDTRNGKDLFALEDGHVRDTSTLPGFTIRAITKHVGSVVFYVNGRITKVESFETFAIACVRRYQGLLRLWRARPVNYNITAIPYSQAGGQGMHGAPFSAVLPSRCEWNN